MALAVTLKTSGSSVEDHGTGAATTASFTPADNSLLVIGLTCVDNAAGDISTALTIADSLGGGALTYTARVTQGHAGGGFAQGRVWTAPVTTGASMTLSFDCGANNIYWYKWFVFEVTGYDTGTPTGGTASAALGDGSNGSFNGSHSITLSSAPASGDYTLAFLGADANSSSSQQVTPGADFTESGELNPSTGSFLGYAEAQQRTGSTSTTVNWVDTQGGTGAFSGVLTALVIKVSAGGGTDDLAGTIAATAGTSADLSVDHSLAASSAAAASTAADLSVAHSLVGSSAAVSSTSGDLFNGKLIAGTSAATSSTSGDLAVAHALTASSAAVAATTGDLAAAHSLVASSTPAASTSAALTVSSAHPFVTSIDASGRFFLDQNSLPIFVQGCSPQDMAGVYTPTEVTTLFEDQAARGINAAQVHAVVGHNTGSENYNGDPPFSNMTALTGTNSAYWSHVDYIFDQAEANGITIFFTVLDNITHFSTAQNLSSAEAFAYGQFLGARYGDRPNLVWVVGNDWQPDWSAGEQSYRRMIDGVQDQESVAHLVTVWLNYTTSVSTDLIDVGGYTAWESMIDVNAVYDYALPYHPAQLAYERSGSGDPRPVLGYEWNYEGAHYHSEFGQGSTTRLTVRRDAWWTVTSGGCGQFFGQDNVINANESLDLTSGALGSDYALDNEFLGRLMTSLPNWQDLVPDYSSTALTGGRGTKNTADDTDPLDNAYATCAYTADGSLLVAYFPDSRGSITVDTGELGANPVAEWWDPTLTIAQTPVSEGTPSAPTHPGTNDAGDEDWVLVITSSVSQALAGTSVGQSATTGALAVAHSLAGQTDGASATTGALLVAHSLVGSSAGVAATTGAITRLLALSGTSAAHATTSADLSGGNTNIPFGPLLGSPEFYGNGSFNDGSYQYWTDFTP